MWGPIVNHGGGQAGRINPNVIAPPIELLSKPVEHRTRPPLHPAAAGVGGGGGGGSSSGYGTTIPPRPSHQNQ